MNDEQKVANQSDNSDSDFKAQVNKYLSDVFQLDALTDDSSLWDVIDGLASNYDVNTDNKSLLPLAYACTYVIIENDALSGVNDTASSGSSVSIGNMSISNVDATGSSISQKAFDLLKQHGFLTSQHLDVVNG